jgi:hypothetical protein
MGSGIITFAGALAVMFMAAFAAPRGWKQWTESRLWAYLWFLIGLVPIAVVCVMWAHMGDQPLWAIKIVLCSILAAGGIIAGLAISEAVYPTANAQQHNPSTTSPPTAATPPTIGSNNTVVSLPPPASMGSGNTFVGPTNSNGNTIFNRGGTAIGTGAKADSTSIAIGAGALAGSPAYEAKK